MVTANHMPLRRGQVSNRNGWKPYPHAPDSTMVYLSRTSLRMPVCMTDRRQMQMTMIALHIDGVQGVPTLGSSCQSSFFVGCSVPVRFSSKRPSQPTNHSPTFGQLLPTPLPIDLRGPKASSPLPHPSTRWTPEAMGTVTSNAAVEFQSTRAPARGSWV